MRAVLAAIGSWMVPGVGDALIGRHRAMLAWVAVSAAVTLACVIRIELLLLLVLLRFAAAIASFRQVRAADRPGTPSDWLGVLIAVGLTGVLGVGLRATVAQSFSAPSSSMAPTIVIGDHVLASKLSLRWRPPAHGEVIVFSQPCEPDRDYLKRVIALAGETVEIRCNTVHVNGKPLASRLVQGAGCTYDDQFDTEAREPRDCSEYAETVDGLTYHVYHEPGRPARDADRAAILTSDARDFPRLDGDRQPPSCAQVGPATASQPTASGQLPGSIVATRAGATPCELQLHYVVPPGHVFVLGDNRPNSSDSRFWGSVPVDLIKGRVVSRWWNNGPAGISWGRLGRIE